MYKEGVYEYIIDNVNNLLEQGIDYYKDDTINRAKLIRYYEYINEVKEETNNTSEVLECNCSNTCIKEENTIRIRDLSDSFMNKLTNIKISVLNLENDLSLYYKEENDDKKIDLDATGVIKPIKIESIIEETSDDSSTSIFDIFRKKK